MKVELIKGRKVARDSKLKNAMKTAEENAIRDERRMKVRYFE